MDKTAQAAKAVRFIEKVRTETLSFNEYNNHDLVHGLPGIALFHSDAQKLFFREDSEEYLYNFKKSFCLNGLPRRGLFHGVEGAIWSLDHILNTGTKELGQLYSSNDAQLQSYIDQSHFLTFDLVSGLAGMLVYAFDRQNVEPNENLAASILSRLNDLSTSQNERIFWKTHRYMYPNLNEYMKGYDTWTDIGVAHGTPGVLATICKLNQILPSTAIQSQIQKISEWIVENRQLNLGSRYPYFVEEPGRSRLAWCYGDLSVALSLSLASEIINQEELRVFATDLALNAFSNNCLGQNANDISLCHGSAGLAMISHCLEKRLGEPKFNFFTQYWIEKTLDGLDSTVRDDSFGLIEGKVGVASALLKLMFSVSISSDRLMLLH